MNSTGPFFLVLIFFLFILQLIIFWFIFWTYSLQTAKKEIRGRFFANRFDYFYQVKTNDNKWEIFGYNYFYWHKKLPFIPQNFVSEANFFHYLPARQRGIIQKKLRALANGQMGGDDFLYEEKITIKNDGRQQTLFFTIDNINVDEKKLSGAVTNYFSLERKQ